MAPRGREGSIADLRCGQPVPHPLAHREPSPSATHKPFRVQPRGLTLPALSLQLRPHPFLRALRPLFPPGPAASNPGPPKSLQSRKAGPAARVASAQVPPAPSPHPPQRQPSPPFPSLPQPPRRPPRLPRLLAAGKMRYAALPQTRPARDPLRLPRPWAPGPRGPHLPRPSPEPSLAGVGQHDCAFTARPRVPAAPPEEGGGPVQRLPSPASTRLPRGGSLPQGTDRGAEGRADAELAGSEPVSRAAAAAAQGRAGRTVLSARAGHVARGGQSGSPRLRPPPHPPSSFAPGILECHPPRGGGGGGGRCLEILRLGADTRGGGIWPRSPGHSGLGVNAADS